MLSTTSKARVAAGVTSQMLRADDVTRVLPKLICSVADYAAKITNGGDDAILSHAADTALRPASLSRCHIVSRCSFITPTARTA